MKARIERDALRAAIKTVLPATQTRAAQLPILSCVRLSVVNADWLRLTTTDLDLTIRTTVPASLTAEGMVAVPARLFAAVLDKAPDGPISLCLAAGKLDIAAADTLASLHTMDVDEWPRTAEPPSNMTALTEEQVQGIARVLPSASVDPNRPTLTTIHIDGDRIEATDSYCAMIARLPGTALPEAIVPAAAVAAMVRSSTGPLTIGIDERTVSFASADTSWTMGTVEGQYPDLSHMIRDTSPHTLTFPADRLSEAVDRVQAIGGINPVEIQREGDKATVSIDHPELGRIDDVVPCSGDFDGLARFNPSLLLQAIVAAGTDEFTLELVDGMKPAVIRSDDFEQLLCTVRPPVGR